MCVNDDRGGICLLCSMFTKGGHLRDGHVRLSSSIIDFHFPCGGRCNSNVLMDVTFIGSNELCDRGTQVVGPTPRGGLRLG